MRLLLLAMYVSLEISGRGIADWFRIVNRIASRATSRAGRLLVPWRTNLVDTALLARRAP